MTESKPQEVCREIVDRSLSAPLTGNEYDLHFAAAVGRVLLTSKRKIHDVYVYVCV